MTLYPPTAQQILGAFEALGHRIFRDPRGHDLNIFGVRTVGGEPNAFDDWIGVLYLLDGRWCCYVFPGTTDPGRYWLLHPMRVEGTAVLKPGQYRGSHVLGTHKGYPALRQDRPMTVWRDPDRDPDVDEGGVEQAGIFGINIHRAATSRVSDTIGKWSAGCQVIQDPDHFAMLMALVRRSAETYGPRFSYTLIRSSDLP